MDWKKIERELKKYKNIETEEDIINAIELYSMLKNNKKFMEGFEIGKAIAEIEKIINLLYK